jgi:hypothetical protein
MLELLSEFSREHIPIFKKVKYILSDNNILIKNIKKERKLIKNFIKNNNININIKKVEPNKYNQQIKEYAETSWVDTKNVIKELDKLDKNYIIKWYLNTSTESHKNKIYIRTSDSNILKRIKYIIYFIEYLKNKNKLFRPVNAWLIMTNLKKIRPEENKIIGIKSVNTGYTDFSKNIIFLWRHEEIDKVFLHEIIHYLDMDHRDEHVKDIAQVSSNGSFYEAITDFWAIYYHIILVSLITRINIKYLLELELGFIKNQALMINEHLKLGSWKEKPKILVKQNTPAFSYYLIKYLLFEYFLENNLDFDMDYEKLLKIALLKGIQEKDYIKIESSRMSLISLL